MEWINFPALLIFENRYVVALKTLLSPYAKYMNCRLVNEYECK